MEKMKQVVEKYHWSVVTIALMLSIVFFNEHTEAQISCAVLLMYILMVIR